MKLLPRICGRVEPGPAERNVLAGGLVERDQEIIRGDAAAATTASFKVFNNPRRFSLGRPEMNVISRIIRSSE